jgi:hypothetical protein
MSTSRVRTLAVRIMAGVAVLAWLWTGRFPAAGGCSAAVEAERRLGVPLEERWSGRDAAGLVALAVAANGTCPRDQTVMVVTDQPVAWLLPNYLLYPRRLYVVQPPDGLTAADFDDRPGGCVLSYGEQRRRLVDFAPRLSSLVCHDGDCLHRIGGAGR